MPIDNDEVESVNEPSLESENEDSAYFLNYIRYLESEIKRLEKDSQVLEAERLRLQRNYTQLKNEFDRLKTPPLFTGSIVELIDKNRAIVKSSSGPQLVVNVSKAIKKSDLLVDTKVGLNQRTFAIIEVLPQSEDPLAKAMEVQVSPNVSYSDIGGLESQIREVREVIELPLLNPELFKKVGIRAPNGVLLHGPPGTGKTLLAKAIAKETNATFIKIIASEFVQKFIGEGARLVREIFKFAKNHQPAIIFIDELDAIGARRIDVAISGDREVQRTLMQLLSSIDGFEDNGAIKIMAATNRPDILDNALLRPGRFDRLVEVPNPKEDGRKEILKIHLKNMNLDQPVESLKFLIDKTNGFSGADLSNICIEAGMFAIRGRREVITQADFKNAINKMASQRGYLENRNPESFV